MFSPLPHSHTSLPISAAEHRTACMQCIAHIDTFSFNMMRWHNMQQCETTMEFVSLMSCTVIETESGTVGAMTNIIYVPGNLGIPAICRLPRQSPDCPGNLGIFPNCLGNLGVSSPNCLFNLGVSSPDCLGNLGMSSPNCLGNLGISSDCHGSVGMKSLEI